MEINIMVQGKIGKSSFDHGNGHIGNTVSLFNDSNLRVIEEASQQVLGDLSLVFLNGFVEIKEFIIGQVKGELSDQLDGNISGI